MDAADGATGQRGAATTWLLLLIAILLGVIAWLLVDEDAGSELRREARIRALETIGDAAAGRMAAGGGDGGQTHGSAVDLIERPIEVRKVADNVYYATGVGNTVMVTTADGVVIFDTGLVIQSARQLRALREQVSDAPVRYIVLSHSHADHVGGARLWQEPGSNIIAHRQFEEEQRYLTELDPYFYQRNRTLFPWMPAEPTEIGLLNYRGIVPDIKVEEGDTFRFELGGTVFEAMGAAGAEGADNLVLWLPEQKILLSGDFFGPQFPQFPNVFTMRGEKVRKPMEYVVSLDRLLPLAPEIVVPSHLDPTVGAQAIRAGMTRIRDAVRYVHDATVAGMNAGRSVYELMREIRLPPELELVQNHGKVDWAVKSIWEYYATWFHYDSTTELYPVPAREVYPDIGTAAGEEALLSLAQDYLDRGEPVKALHAIEVTVAAWPDHRGALALRERALRTLLEISERGLRNDYEIYWLKARLADTRGRLAADG